MIKAVFFDLDGTLISNTTGGIPKSARKSIDCLRMNGVRVFTATGRHMRSKICQPLTYSLTASLH